jgi:hypothetical protein
MLGMRLEPELKGVLVAPGKNWPTNRWRIEITRVAEKQITSLARPTQKGDRTLPA